MGKLSRNSEPSSVGLSAKIARATGVQQVRLEQRIQSLWSGYGELWRVRLDEQSVIVKHVRPPPSDNSISHRRKLRSYEVEHAFYRLHARTCTTESGCRVPQPRALLAEDGGWLFVLEDLDQSGLGKRRAHADRPSIEAVLRWLARFHARFLSSQPDQLWKVGTYWHLQTRPDELRALRHAELRAAAPRIDERLSRARFKTFVHGDAKLENVCFAQTSSEVALVDFQYVGGGVGIKDVAYLLSGCVAARDCARQVPGYLDAYFAEFASALRGGGSSIDPSEVEREWRELFPLAWVDFHRFLLGWAPTTVASDPYSERLTAELLARFRPG